MTGRPVSFSFPIAKVDQAQRQVSGFATLEVPDKQNELVDFNASVAAFREWPGNIREGHNKQKAVGVCVGWQPVPEQRGIWVTAQISKSRDGEDCWLRIQEGVLKGFSIGGEAIDSKTEVNKAGRALRRITKYRLDELSLVDNPACPGATIQLVKTVGGGMSSPTEVVEKVEHRSLKKQAKDMARWAGPHPLEVVTGSGMSGTRYKLIGKSANGLYGLYADDTGRGRQTFIARHVSGARQWSNDVHAVQKFTTWEWLPGETLFDDADLSNALTTRDGGARPTGSGAYTDRRNTVPGDVLTDVTDGQWSGGPSATTPAEVRARSGQKPLRPGLHSNDPVLDRRLNQPDRDPRSESYDRLALD